MWSKPLVRIHTVITYITCIWSCSRTLTLAVWISFGNVSKDSVRLRTFWSPISRVWKGIRRNRVSFWLFVTILSFLIGLIFQFYLISIGYKYFGRSWLLLFFISSFLNFLIKYQYWSKLSHLVSLSWPKLENDHKLLRPLMRSTTLKLYYPISGDVDAQILQLQRAFNRLKMSTDEEQNKLRDEIRRSR